MKRSRSDLENWVDSLTEFGTSMPTPSTPTLSGSSVLDSEFSTGSPSTHARNTRKRRKLTVDADLAKHEFIERFDKLKFLRKERPYRGMDSELKFADPDPALMVYLETHPEIQVPVEVKDWKFVEANSVVELNHLERFNRNYPDFPEEWRAVIELAVNHVEDLLTLDVPLVFPKGDELREVRYQGDKFAGIEYARRGLKTRFEANEMAQLDAEIAFEALMKGERVEPHVNRIGGRGKLVKVSKLEATAEKPQAGRLIFMTSHRDLKLNGLTEQLLTHAYKSTAFPISVGDSWWHGGANNFFERFKRFTLFSCFDAEKFDSSLPPFLIRISINIMRNQFVDGMDAKYDAYWEFIYDGLVRAPVFLDNGMMFERVGGSTSGHSFNTLMQSICTLVIAYTCFIAAHGAERAKEVFEQVWVEGLGDDQHTGAEGACAEYDIDVLAPFAQRIFGVLWWGDKSFNTERLVDTVLGAFQGSQYLGKYLRILDEEVEGARVQGVIPYRPFEETFLRLYYPERGEKTYTAAWQRAIGHYADAAGNPQSRAFLEGYLDWLEDFVDVTEPWAWSQEQRRKFGQGNPDSGVQVPARRISYLEWLLLVLEPLS